MSTSYSREPETPDALRYLFSQLATWRRIAAARVEEPQRAMPTAMRASGVSMLQRFVLGVRLLSAEQLQELVACGDDDVRDAAFTALADDARRAVVDTLGLTEPLAPEQLRWLHELAASQEAEARRQDDLMAAASLRAAFMRQCAADAHASFTAGVRLLQPKLLQALLASPDDDLREATIAVLDEAASTKSATADPAPGPSPRGCSLR